MKEEKDGYYVGEGIGGDGDGHYCVEGCCAADVNEGEEERYDRTDEY